MTLAVSSGLEKQKEIKEGRQRKKEGGEGGLDETGGMTGACQMKASQSALKSTHTFPFSPSLSCRFSVHRLLEIGRAHV